MSTLTRTFMQRVPARSLPRPHRMSSAARALCVGLAQLARRRALAGLGSALPRPPRSLPRPHRMSSAARALRVGLAQLARRRALAGLGSALPRPPRSLALDLGVERVAQPVA